MIRREEVVHIGELTRPHGKKGEILCRTDNGCWEEADPDFLIVSIDNILVPFRVTDWRCKGEDLILTIDRVDSEPAALRLCGNEAFMLRRDCAEEDNGQPMTWQDLKGFAVLDEKGGSVGRITEVDESTANVLAVLSDGRLIPLHEDLITGLDSANRTIMMCIPVGL